MGEVNASRSSKLVGVTDALETSYRSRPRAATMMMEAISVETTTGMYYTLRDRGKQSIICVS
jgi:hypothetical protein